MIVINNEQEFKKIAYALMRVFNNIEAITISEYATVYKMDLWKTTELRNYGGIYANRAPSYCRAIYGFGNRNRTHLINSLNIKVNYIPIERCVTRSVFLTPYKQTNRVFVQNQAKERLSKIANIMKLKKINIAEGNIYTIVDEENLEQTVSFRGANSGITYKGEIVY
jgi:hypothetical protein